MKNNFLIGLILSLSACHSFTPPKNLKYIQGGYAQETIEEINLIEHESSCKLEFKDINISLIKKTPDLEMKDGVILKGLVEEKWESTKCGHYIEYVIKIEGDPHGMVDTDVRKISQG